MPETGPTTPDFAVKSTSVRRTLILWVTCATAVATAAAAVYYGTNEGAHSAIGAVVGGLLVGAFFVSGTALATLSTRPDQPEGMVLLYALAGYTGQVVGLFIVMIVFRHTTLFDHRAFGVTIILTTIVALAAAVVGFVRAKIPTIVPAVAPGGPLADAQDRL